MDEIRFQVKGSAGQIHDITIRKSGKNMTALCGCPNGGKEQMCEHRIKLLAGITNGIVSPNVDDVKLVRKWLDGTDIGKALRQVVEANKRFENAQEEMHEARRALVKALND